MTVESLEDRYVVKLDFEEREAVGSCVCEL